MLTCLKCMGNKKYMAIGFILIKCESCNGTGKIEPKVLEAVKKRKRKVNAEEIRESEA